MVKASRKNIEVGRDRWETLQRITGKTTNAEVLEELQRLAKKALKEDGPAKAGGTESATETSRSPETVYDDSVGVSRSGLSSQKDPSSTVLTPRPLPQATENQSTLTAFVPENWQQDYQERKLQYLLQQLGFEERKLEFRERAFEQILQFKRELFEFEKSKRHILPVDSGGYTVTHSSPDYPVCTFCCQGRHQVLECPELIRERERWNKPALPDSTTPKQN
jgi:hypothetical protein